jgi:CspA family cold shock protein
LHAGVDVWRDVYAARLEAQPKMGLPAFFCNVSGNACTGISLGDETNLKGTMTSGHTLVQLYISGIAIGHAKVRQSVIAINSVENQGKEMTHGTIKKITQKGFGFIETPSGQDLFFHSSAVEGIHFTQLREGQRVSYELGSSPKGPCAHRVQPVDDN